MAGTADHPIEITPHPGEVVVMHQGEVVLRTRAALSLREAHYPPVLYMPRADADMNVITPNPHRSHCPYKGDASYFDLHGAPAAVWSYERPHADVREIAGHLAFYPDKVEIRTSD